MKRHWKPLAVAAGVAAVLLWPVIVVIVEVAVAVVTAVWAGLYYVLAFEGLVAVGAALDWRDADLNIESRRHAFAIAHVTVWRRAWRRVVWLARGVKATRAQLRKPTAPQPDAAPAPRPVEVPARRGVQVA